MFVFMHFLFWVLPSFFPSFFWFANVLHLFLCASSGMQTNVRGLGALFSRARSGRDVGGGIGDRCEDSCSSLIFLTLFLCREFLLVFPSRYLDVCVFS